MERNKQRREFLETLSSAELRLLLDTPAFTGEVLEHAPESEILSRRVDEILNAEYREMSKPEKEQVGRIATRAAKKFTELLRVQENKPILSHEHSRAFESIGHPSVVRPGEAIRFKGIFNVRTIKEFVIRLANESSNWQRIPIMWGELPAAASGGSAALPTLAPVGLKDRVFQLEQVNADLNTNEATLRLRLVEGPRYPVPELEVFLILEDGEIIAPEETLNDTTDHSSH